MTPRVLPSTIALVATLAAAGCVRPIFPGSQQVFARGNERQNQPGVTAAPNVPGTSRPDSSLGLARQQVKGKEEPATLIAVDGTRCTVSEARFRDVAHGDKVWCPSKSTASDRALGKQ